jgi:DNA-binding FrmR family transcriptional regulator
MEATQMAHTIRDKQKLLNRVRRIQGQLTAVEKALEQEQDCSTILLTIAACRGAINGLMAEIIEGHIRFHVVDPDREPTTEKARAAQELIDVVKAYLK